MLSLKIAYGLPPKTKIGVGILMFYENDSNLSPLLKKYGLRSDIVRDSGFAGKRDEIFEINQSVAGNIGDYILLGLGRAQLADNARRAGGQLANLIAKRKIRKAVLLSLADLKDNIGPFIEGLLLGGYSFDMYKSEKTSPISFQLIFDGSIKSLKNKIDKAITIAEAACFARDLVNTPGNHLPPVELANRAKSLAKSYGIKCRIYDQRELAAMKMGALLGVAMGSEQPPRLIVWTYNGAGAKAKPIVFVGKGVTFDSGGISIKPSEGMQEMKNDMAGAAAVTALMMVLGKLKPRLNVIGIAPCVENMPSGKALRPGDIVTVCDGQTIEIISTDAEGRLILADALCFAEKLKPKAIIDIATLTGAVVVALGNYTAGILGNDEKLLRAFYEAGQRSAEKTWQLPLWDEYRDQIKSDVADMKNSGGRPAGSITAACLLSKFVKNTPWIHVDIAGVDNQDKNHPYQPKGATGFGVRLFAEFLLGLE